jgi:SAM-dependent methyltransferase
MDRTDWLTDVMRRKLERFDVLYAPVYDESWSAIGEQHAAFVNRVIRSVRLDGVILDAACGTGRFFSMILGSGRRVVGVDSSGGMLARAKSKFPEVTTEFRRLQNLEFEGAFDAVICVDALENLPPEDWLAALSSLRRAGRSGGSVYVTVELVGEVGALAAAFDAARAKGWPVVWGEVATDDGYHFYPERGRVRRWLHEAGLVLVDEIDSDCYWHLFCQAAPAG